MYALEFLPSALNDIVEIAQYITEKLHNPQAALNLTNKCIQKAELVCELPHSNRVFSLIKPLKYEYRRIIVDNYSMFYRIDEHKKTVIIARVIYAKRNITEAFFDTEA